MENVKKRYLEAHEDGYLPGFALMASSQDGDTVIFSGGKQSLNPNSANPFTENTICALASMTKLLTAVVVLQCIEHGLLNLDANVNVILPEVGKYDIITGWDDETNQGIFQSITTPITLRMLLTHTSGHAYDWFRPALKNWRASRGEQPWLGATVEQKATIPLVFAPGTQFAYGVGVDWAGKMVERVTGQTLEVFMKERIWEPLGMRDVTFWPKERGEFEGRMAGMNRLGENGEGRAEEVPGFDIGGGATDCLGGGGAFASTKAYFTFLQAVLRRDEKILKKTSWQELFRPQLSPELKAFFNEYLHADPLRAQYLAMGIPASITKTWCFAGMICEDAQEGRFSAGTVFWGGMPSMAWWIDGAVGTCGLATCQVMPPMCPKIMALHEKFQRAVFGGVGIAKSTDALQAQ
ncbi:beta-lactamase/transpeptidase-like protein [Polyplosphaeria fusca]|uniref:Beta-lactamase/transpeptidase-like protein n=1 Tax=Polyplosphaeria fusca TaxID=682080 RepID=A0A9P4QMU5_9PLEO|nr:beta-lactamase/transpeptidase-like protein [Polyplosphaeria fusca]